jgi:magnesium-protoporphyrin IX monomethyl ester (oxidative) cyclase
MFRITERQRELKSRGGLFNAVRRGALTVAAVATFARLYLLPTQPNATPDQVRLAPAW